MPAIDHLRLQKALDGSEVTPKMLATECDISLQYACDILAGRRTLKRNPSLRKKIAKVANVPVDWIEVQRPAEKEPA